MSRDIGKYRGQTKEGKWVTGCLFQCKYSKKVYIVLNEYSADELMRDEALFLRFAWHEVVPETVGEFTGIPDKNGLELAAGDKYKWLGWEVRAGKQIRPERIETIRDDTPEHWIEDCHKLWCISTGNSQGTVEVIGNIHEEGKT